MNQNIVTFFCPEDGLQKAVEIQKDTVVCPICNQFLVLGGRVWNDELNAKIKSLEDEKIDLSDKLKACETEEMKAVIFEKMKLNKQKLEELKSYLNN